LADLQGLISFPGARKGLDRFVEFRKTHRTDEAYNVKDGAYSPSSPLKGIRHCHVVYGKVIIVYNDVGNEVRLMRTITHAEQEGKFILSLAAYCRSLEAGDFVPFAVREQRTLEDGEIAEINDLILGMLTNDSDRAILEKASSGNFDEFMDFVRFYVENDMNDDDILKAIFLAFNGEDNLKRFLDRSLKHSEVSSSLGFVPG
jgi:hypothetical protein